MKESFTAIIIDDESKSRNILKNILLKYCPIVNVIAVAENVNTAYQLITEHQPDMIFLDIHLRNERGFDLLEKFESRAFEVIFVTGYIEYAINAIKARAFDYLLKPISIDELIEVVSRLKDRIFEKREILKLKEIKTLSSPVTQTKQIIVPSKDGKHFVSITDVVRCKADGSCTWIFLADGTKLFSSKNLGEFDNLLLKNPTFVKKQFYRSHYSDLINLEFIEKLVTPENLIILKDGTKLKIAQRRKSGLIKALKSIIAGDY